MRVEPTVPVLAAVLALVACGQEQSEPEPLLRPVRYERVAAVGATETRTLAGVVRSGVESRLSFRVPGTVEWLGVAVGDRVRRGQVLARLDATDYELRVEEAEAALAQGQATWRRAEADYDRVRALYESNNAAKSELDAARAGAESAEAQVNAALKRLEQARQQVGYSVLRAPAAGAVASVDVEVNENVGGGDQVCLLISGGEPEVVVAVPEVMIADIRMDQEVEISLDALPGLQFSGRVSEVGVAVTGAASTFAVTARLADPDIRIRSGMAADVTFRFRDEAAGERIVVPGVAVGEDRQGRHVFVVEPGPAGEGVVRRRAVTIDSFGEAVAVIEGLEAGELVVTAGARRLADGMRVRLPGPGEGG